MGSEKMGRDIARARELAAIGRVTEARKILARYDLRHVVVEIVPGETRRGEVK